MPTRDAYYRILFIDWFMIDLVVASHIFFVKHFRRMYRGYSIRAWWVEHFEVSLFVRKPAER